MKRIFLIGYMGSGKSAMGRMLAKHLDLDFIDLDAYIENKYRLSIAQIFELEGEKAFREKEKYCLEEVAEFENVVIATGGGAPCFYNNMELMNAKGKTIYLKLTAEHLSKRLAGSKPGLRPILQNKTGDELFRFIQEKLAEREKYYEQAHYIIEGSDKEIEDALLGLDL